MRTLYFKNLSGLMAVAADLAGENLELGPPRPVAGGVTAKVWAPELDYTPVHDGEGFIVVAEARGTAEGSPSSRTWGAC